MPYVHVFGDSHTQVFSAIPNAVVHRTNGMSMREVGELGLRFDLTRWGRKEQHDAIFVFGAVDARVHIGRQALDHNCHEINVIKEVATKFVQKVHLFCMEWELQGFISSVTPAVDLALANPEAIIPTLGNLEERIARTNRLDTEVASECRKYDSLCWFDPHLPYRMPRGELNMEHTDKICHLTDDCQETIAAIFESIRSARQASCLR